MATHDNSEVLQHQDYLYEKLKEQISDDELEQLKKYAGEDSVEDFLTVWQKAQETSKTLDFKTLVPTLDKMTKGFSPGQLVTLSGPTGHGKTTFAQNLTENLREGGHNCLWFSYEMGVEEFFSKFKNLPFAYMPKKVIPNSWEWLEARIKEAVAKYQIDIVFIDHLHYLLEMDKLSQSGSLSLAVGSMMRNLKRLAVNFDLVIVLVAHLRKVVLGKTPSIEDLRDSSLIGQESDLVMIINRLPDEGGEFSQNSTLNLVKNRRTGQLGKVNLAYEELEFKEIGHSSSESNNDPLS